MEPSTRNTDLWQQAKARTNFQSSLLVYLLVNALLWVIWAANPHPAAGLPWPVWSMLFWGLGLTLRGIAAYSGFSREQRIQREYERLLQAERNQKEG